VSRASLDRIAPHAAHDAAVGAAERPFAVAVAGAKGGALAVRAGGAVGRRLSPSVPRKDAGQWPYSLAAPRLPAGGEAHAAVGGAWQRPYAQTGSAEPSEEAPIPFEGAEPSSGARWPYALPFLADQVIKQGYTLPLPRGVSIVYTYVQRDIKVSSVTSASAARTAGREQLH
jgi:hypothetical protein